jgi:hypothetical protein
MVRSGQSLAHQLFPLSNMHGAFKLVSMQTPPGLAIPTSQIQRLTCCLWLAMKPKECLRIAQLADYSVSKTQNRDHGTNGRFATSIVAISLDILPLSIQTPHAQYFMSSLDGRNPCTPRVSVKGGVGFTVPHQFSGPHCSRPTCGVMCVCAQYA